MVATAINKKKKVLKRTKKFTRFEFEDYNGKMKPNWRRPRGIDSRIRRQFRGNKPLVKIGYGTNKNTRFVLPNGFKKVLINNEKDLDCLLMNNRTFAGELANNLSAKLKKKLIERSKELNIKLTNAKGKVTKEEKKNN